MNYEVVVLYSVTMVFSIALGVFLSNVCHSGLSNYSGVVLGSMVAQ